MRTFTSYQNDITRIINNSDTDSVAWATETVNDSLRYLITRYYFNERTYTTSTVSQQQFYNLPPQVKKLINITVTVGTVLWIPRECPSRDMWDSLNVITFYQDFPSFFFVYNGQVGIFPAPSSSSNLITMHYKTRVRDLSVADYNAGTVSITSNTLTLSGSGTAWYNDMVNRWVRINTTTSNTTNGDYQWYQIAAVNSATSLTLFNPYSGNTVTGGSYTIGEVPILPEDYQDLPLYRMAIIYYTTRFPDEAKASQYQKLYDDGMAELDVEYGSKTDSVVLTDTDTPIYNPNLFQSSLTKN